MLETEIVKNKKLINQIDDIMNNSKIDGKQEVINSGFFKNNAQLLTTLQSQKNIATNRNNYLLNEQKLVKKKIIINSLKKIKADEIEGTINGNITGNANTATNLKNVTSFQLQGDVISDAISFDGQVGSYTKVFSTELTANIITTKNNGGTK